MVLTPSFEPYQSPRLSRYNAAPELGADMRRRKFISLLGGAAAWPLAVCAQQPAMPVIGFLGSPSAAEWTQFTAAFRQGLRETGYVEGQNAAIEYRWAQGQYERLPELAGDLVRRQVAVIFAAGSVAPAVAAKSVTATLPIVFANGVDPVQFGLVASLNRPGANITGVSFLTGDLGAKRLGLLHELLPNVTVIAVLVKSDNPNATSVVRDAQEAARLRGLELHPLRARSAQDIDVAFASLAQRQVGALMVSADPFFTSQADQFAQLAARHKVPTIYHAREFVAAGGLMSYGTSIREAYRQAGVYTGKILKGEKAADLPVLQSTKFELVINQANARA
jgi:putative tryptophan/tyrosine transport system substrate-binding protein